MTLPQFAWPARIDSAAEHPGLNVPGDPEDDEEEEEEKKKQEEDDDEEDNEGEEEEVPWQVGGPVSRTGLKHATESHGMTRTTTRQI